MRRFAPFFAFLALLAPSAGHAQRAPHVTTLEISLPPIPRAQLFVRVRPRPPAMTEADVPEASVPLLVEARDRERAVVEWLSSHTQEERRVLSASELDPLLAQLAEANRALTASLQRAPSLERGAMLGLGTLLLGEADIRFERALEAFAACTERGAAERQAGGTCEDPVRDDAEALAVWARIEGEDRIATEALLQRAWSLADGGWYPASRALIRRALEMTGVTMSTEAHLATLLGTLESDDRAARQAYARAAIRNIEGISPLAAHAAATIDIRLGRWRDAITILAPYLWHPHVGADARLFVGEAVARLGGRVRSFRDLPAEQRAMVLRLGAAESAREGLLFWACENEREAARAELQPTSSTPCTAVEETARAFVERALIHCAQTTRLRPEPSLLLEIRVRRSQPRIRALRAPPVLSPLVQCLVEQAPPTRVVGGPYRFRVVSARE